MVGAAARRGSSQVAYRSRHSRAGRTPGGAPHFGGRGPAGIAGLVASSGAANGPELLALLAGLVETINAERAEVIAGIERFGRGQKQLAAALRDESSKLDAMRADTKADPAKLTELTDQLVWNLRIFDERQKSLRFVCEVPVLIEQRLFALSRAIQNALQLQ
jgi:hypothetical protein